MRDGRYAELFAEARRRGLPQEGLLLVTVVSDQSVVLWDSAGRGKRFVVSTAKAGTGNIKNSFKTPLGWHRIAERIGGDELPGSVFVSRIPQGRRLAPSQWRDPDDGDYVLTRILWLRGLEPGINAGGNVDSYSRYIYFHGTNQEHLLGQPSSHGCIRLSNRDVMELFDLVEEREAWCYITESL
jgi:hypothetical protein